jgi:DNA-binding NtrC family response regulator
MIRVFPDGVATQRDTTVYVVDNRPSDYRHLVQANQDSRQSFAFLSDARSALRVNPSSNRAVWIINLDLPDMSGTDLYSMLRLRFPASPVFLVGDEYRAEQERAARMSGASLYFCKPIQQEWLDETRAKASA